MGIDIEGACQQFVNVDVTQIFDIGMLDPHVAVFAEPVAATLGILNSNIHRNEKGIILGQGRIAELAHRVLVAKGFETIQIASPSDSLNDLQESSCDFVIETGVDTDLFQEMVRLVRPHGKLILKSRLIRPFEVTMRDVIRKQPSIDIVNYGMFDEAVRLLVSKEVAVDDLIGSIFAFPDIESAIELALECEDRKVLLAGWS